MSQLKGRPSRTSLGMLKNSKAIARSKSIDQQLEEDREKRQKEIQLLILGGAGSGKSTFIKQLNIHHGDGFPEAIRKNMVCFVHKNLMDALNLLTYSMDKLGLDFSSTENKDLAKTLQTCFPWWRRHRHTSSSSSSSPLPPDGSTIAEADETSDNAGSHELSFSDYRDLNMRMCAYWPGIRSLWRDPGLQQCFTCKELLDTGLQYAETYFLDNFERVTNDSYVPTVQDVLRIRTPTVGVQEHLFRHHDLEYRVIDVAGQKNQRKKWIHFFEEVTAVLFMAAISGYCECLEEDSTLNSLMDSIHTFEDVVNNKFLEKKDFMLFLNKKDIFEQHLQNTPLIVCFPDYAGDNSLENATEFIKQRFDQHKPETKHVYCHVTCAVDRDLMKHVVDDVMEIIIQINLRTAGAPL